MSRFTHSNTAQLRSLGLARKAAEKAGHNRKASQIRKQQAQLLDKMGQTKAAYIAYMQEVGYDKIRKAAARA